MSANAKTAGERRVLAEAPSWELVDLSDLPDEQRVVSADTIRRLCVAPESKTVDPRGIRIKHARILELLDLSLCTVPHPLGFVATTFDAIPDLSWAHLPALWIEGCSLPGLLANGIRVDGDLRLGSSGVSSEVQLRGAKIGGQLDCSGGTLSNEGGDALSADGAEIDGDVFLSGGFEATGAVRLPGARIGGQVACSGGTLSSEGGDALVADGAGIGGDVFLSDGFEAIGEVRLPGARIGGQVACVGGTLSNEGGNALSADIAEIDGDVFLSDGFEAIGEVRLRGAKIGGQLDCTGANLVNRTGVDPIAFVARDATIGGALIIRDVRVTGGVDLFRASATTLDDDLGRHDDPLGSWRGVQPLILDSFAYARFSHEAEWGSRFRRQWLEQSTGFQQGAWQQLIEVYRAQGRDDEATRVAIAMHNDRVKRAGLPWYRRWGRRVLWAVVGHGYRSWLAGIWATAIIAAFAFVVWHWSGMFVPAKQGATGSPQPVAYAADAFLPIVDLGQTDEWKPTGWVRWVDWSVILLGWSLTTLFVAGFTRIVRNE
jgi:hypothetical protein